MGAEDGEPGCPAESWRGGAQMTPSARVAVMGTGAWGTTLARLIALEQIRCAQSAPERPPAPQRPVTEVTLWEYEPARAGQLQWGRENAAFLPGFPLPANLRVTADLAEVVAEANVVLLVTPSQRVRENARALAPLLRPGMVVV